LLHRGHGKEHVQINHEQKGRWTLITFAQIKNISGISFNENKDHRVSNHLKN